MHLLHLYGHFIQNFEASVNPPGLDFLHSDMPDQSLFPHDVDMREQPDVPYYISQVDSSTRQRRSEDSKFSPVYHDASHPSQNAQLPEVPQNLGHSQLQLLAQGFQQLTNIFSSRESTLDPPLAEVVEHGNREPSPEDLDYRLLPDEPARLGHPIAAVDSQDALPMQESSGVQLDGHPPYNAVSSLSAAGQSEDLYNSVLPENEMFQPPNNQTVIEEVMVNASCIAVEPNITDPTCLPTDTIVANCGESTIVEPTIKAEPLSDQEMEILDKTPTMPVSVISRHQTNEGKPEALGSVAPVKSEPVSRLGSPVSGRSTPENIQAVRSGEEEEALLRAKLLKALAQRRKQKEDSIKEIIKVLQMEVRNILFDGYCTDTY